MACEPQSVRKSGPDMDKIFHLFHRQQRFLPSVPQRDRAPLCLSLRPPMFGGAHYQVPVSFAPCRVRRSAGRILSALAWLNHSPWLPFYLPLLTFAYLVQTGVFYAGEPLTQLLVSHRYGPRFAFALQQDFTQPKSPTKRLSSTARSAALFPVPAGARSPGFGRCAEDKI